jgi:flagellar hook-associated protein 2
LGLRFDPMGGGQFKEAIKQIMEAERQPLKQLETRKGREEAKMKLFQDFKGKFANFDNTLVQFTNFRKFREIKAEMGDGDKLIGVSIDKEKAVPGSYQVEVLQLAGRSSMVSNGFSSADEAVLGVGFVVLENADGDKEEVYVGGKSSSLNGLANVINAKSKGSVQASVLKDATDPEKPWKLVLNAKKEGLEGEVFFPDFYFLDGEEDLKIGSATEAQNGVLKINGVEVETDGNKVPDFLPGVSLELKQAKEGQMFTLNITEDIPKIAGKVKDLTTQINGILEFINKQNSVDDKTDTRTTFAGDTSLQTIEYRIRNLLHEGFPVFKDEKSGEPARFVNLSEIGVEFDKKGAVQFNEQKFTKALERDYEGVSQAISGEFGFGMQMREVMANYTRPGAGLLATREKGIRGRIDKIDRDIEMKQRLLDRKQEALTQQFSRLQGTLSGMQQQQSYLAASMGGGGGGNMIAQLMGG